MINLIVAVDDRNGIGKCNKLPWHCVEDLKYFKEKTINSYVIMGYNTFISIGKLLPNRHNVICTRQDIIIDGAEVVHDLIEYIKRFDREKELFIIGGESVYRQSMENDLVDRMYITRIDGDYDCDTFFNYEMYKEHYELSNLIIKENTRFLTYDRK